MGAAGGWGNKTCLGWGLGGTGPASPVAGRSSRRAAVPSDTPTRRSDRRGADVLSAPRLSPASLRYSPGALAPPRRCGCPGDRRGWPFFTSVFAVSKCLGWILLSCVSLPLRHRDSPTNARKNRSWRREYHRYMRLTRRYVATSFQNEFYLRQTTQIERSGREHHFKTCFTSDRQR